MSTTERYEQPSRASAARIGELDRHRRSRLTVGKAIGITMARYAMDEEHAVEFLRRLSKTSGVSWRDLVDEVIAQQNAEARD